MKKITTIMFSAFAVLLASASVYGADFSGQLEVLHTTDIHSEVSGSSSSIGYSKLSGYIKQLKDEGKNVLALDSGDAFEGLIFSNFVNGEDMPPILNEVGYDAMALGNHEFTYSRDIMKALFEKTTVPMLSANIVDSEGNFAFEPYIIKDVKGLKVGIFGLTTDNTPNMTSKGSTEGLTFLEPIEAGKEAVKTLKEQDCDYIIAITHLGSADAENNASMKVAEAVDGIDLMLDGHSHVINKGTMCGDTLLVASGYYGKVLGDVKIDFTDSKATNVNVEILTPKELENVKGNEKIDSIVKEYTDRLNTVMSGEVCSTDKFWNGENNIVRSQPTNLGQLIAKAYATETGAEIGIQNGGGVRKSIFPSTVTKADLFSVSPFGNIIATYSIKGKDIASIVKNGLIDMYGTGEYLQLYGLKVEYDSENKTVNSIALADGTPLEDEKEYTVATSTFIGQNTSVYPAIANAKEVKQYTTDYEMVCNYLTNNAMDEAENTVNDTAKKNDTMGVYFNGWLVPDSTAYQYDGKWYLPIRAITVAQNGTVTYEPETKTVEIKLNEDVKTSFTTYADAIENKYDYKLVDNTIYVTEDYFADKLSSKIYFDKNNNQLIAH